MQQITAVHPKLQRNLCNGRNSNENGFDGTLCLWPLIGKTRPITSQPFFHLFYMFFYIYIIFSPLKYYFLCTHVLIVKLRLQLLLPFPTNDFHSLIAEEGLSNAWLSYMRTCDHIKTWVASIAPPSNHWFSFFDLWGGFQPLTNWPLTQSRCTLEMSETKRLKES